MTNFFLSMLAFGNIHQNSHQPDAFTILVVDWFAPGHDPTNGTVGPDHAMLAAVSLPLLNGRDYRRFGPRKVIGVYTRGPGLIVRLYTERHQPHDQEMLLGPLA
jgi:hypothetical protein